MSSKTQAWIGAGIITLLIFGTLGAAYWLQKKIMVQLDSQERLAVERSIVEQEIRDLPMLQKQHAIYTEKRQKIEILPSEDDVVNVVRDIEENARTANLDLSITEQKTNEGSSKKNTNQSVDTDSPQSSQQVTAITKAPFENSVRLQLTVRGSYASIVQFLHKLETAQYAMNVMAIDIAYDKQSEEKITVSRDLETEANPFLLTVDEEAQNSEDVNFSVLAGGVVGLIDLVMYIKK